MKEPGRGTAIAGRYRLARHLASGAFGSVWEARDERLSRHVAVKLLLPSWAESAETRARFEREAKAIARVRSAHIVEIFDYGIEGTSPFIVMELLEGRDFSTLLKGRERLTVTEMVRIVSQAAKALTAAHAAGMVHRDLKPANLFLARSGAEELIKVLDFGVAKGGAHRQEQLHKTEPGAMVGSPAYMSPEQARAAPEIDHRADLWSLAVIAYRGLTGELPFNRDTVIETIVQICSEDFIPPTDHVPELAPEVDVFFKKALAREPDDRFQTAPQLAEWFARISPEGRDAAIHIPDLAPTAVYDPSGAAITDYFTRKPGSGPVERSGPTSEMDSTPVPSSSDGIPSSSSSAASVDPMNRADEDEPSGGEAQDEPFDGQATRIRDSSANLRPADDDDLDDTLSSAPASSSSPDLSVEVADSVSDSAEPADESPDRAHEGPRYEPAPLLRGRRWLLVGAPLLAGGILAFVMLRPPSDGEESRTSTATHPERPGDELPPDAAAEQSLEPPEPGVEEAVVATAADRDATTAPSASASTVKSVRPAVPTSAPAAPPRATSHRSPVKRRPVRPAPVAADSDDPYD